MRPVYRRLAMGQKWSVLLVMLVHLKICTETLGRSRNPKVAAMKVINCLSERKGSRVWAGSEGMVYVHVDDFIMSHEEADVAEAAATAVCLALKLVGFCVAFRMFHGDLGSV